LSRFSNARHRLSTFRQFDMWILHSAPQVNSAWILAAVSTVRQFDSGHLYSYTDGDKLWILPSSYKGVADSHGLTLSVSCGRSAAMPCPSSFKIRCLRLLFASCLRSHRLQRKTSAGHSPRYLQSNKNTFPGKKPLFERVSV
jgi:hypothetical protein